MPSSAAAAVDDAARRLRTDRVEGEEERTLSLIPTSGIIMAAAGERRRDNNQTNDENKNKRPLRPQWDRKPDVAIAAALCEQQRTEQIGDVATTAEERGSATSSCGGNDQRAGAAYEGERSPRDSTVGPSLLANKVGPSKGSGIIIIDCDEIGAPTVDDNASSHEATKPSTPPVVAPKLRPAATTTSLSLDILASTAATEHTQASRDTVSASCNTSVSGIGEKRHRASKNSIAGEGKSNRNAKQKAIQCDASVETTREKAQVGPVLEDDRNRRLSAAAAEAAANNPASCQEVAAASAAVNNISYGQAACGDDVEKFKIQKADYSAGHVTTTAVQSNQLSGRPSSFRFEASFLPLSDERKQNSMTASALQGCSAAGGIDGGKAAAAAPLGNKASLDLAASMTEEASSSSMLSPALPGESRAAPLLLDGNEKVEPRNSEAGREEEAGTCPTQIVSPTVGNRENDGGLKDTAALRSEILRLRSVVQAQISRAEEAEAKLEGHRQDSDKKLAETTARYEERIRDLTKQYERELQLYKGKTREACDLLETVTAFFEEHWTCRQCKKKSSSVDESESLTDYGTRSELGTDASAGEESHVSLDCGESSKSDDAAAVGGDGGMGGIARVSSTATPRNECATSTLQDNVVQTSDLRKESRRENHAVVTVKCPTGSCLPTDGGLDYASVLSMLEDVGGKAEERACFQKSKDAKETIKQSVTAADVQCTRREMPSATSHVNGSGEGTLGSASGEEKGHIGREICCLVDSSKTNAENEAGTLPPNDTAQEKQIAPSPTKQEIVNRKGEGKKHRHKTSSIIHDPGTKVTACWIERGHEQSGMWYPGTVVQHRIETHGPDKGKRVYDIQYDDGDVSKDLEECFVMTPDQYLKLASKYGERKRKRTVISIEEGSLRKTPKGASSAAKGPADMVWECHSCQAHNSMSRLRCLDCRAWKGGKRGLTKESTEGCKIIRLGAIMWECHLCRTQNPMSRLRCSGDGCKAWKGGKRGLTPESTEGCKIVREGSAARSQDSQSKKSSTTESKLKSDTESSKLPHASPPESTESSVNNMSRKDIASKPNERHRGREQPANAELTAPLSHEGFAGQSIAPKRVCRQLFNQIIWPSLQKLGWIIEKGHRSTDYYYMPPGVTREADKGYKNRVDYFDSQKQLLSFLEINERWSSMDEVRSCVELYKSCESVRNDLASQGKLRTKLHTVEWLLEQVTESGQSVEIWHLDAIISKEALAKEPPISCSSEDCHLVACSVWLSNQPAKKPWHSCLDCQEKDFGGWPEVEMLPFSVMSEEHRRLVATKCSQQEVAFMPDVPINLL